MPKEFTLKSARVFRGLTQEQMAEKLNVHRNTYANWESDPENVQIKDALKIAEVLQMPVSSIFMPTALQNVDFKATNTRAERKERYEQAERIPTVERIIYC